MISCPFPPMQAVMVAALAAGIAMGSASVAAAMLRMRAGAASHEQPKDARLPSLGEVELAAEVNRGRALFTSSCSHCHGLDARGDEGPDLHDIQVSDRYITRVIREGIRGEMPAFARKHDSRDIAALIAFLRSLE